MSNFVKCKCRNCDQTIAFDADELNSHETANAECPYCNLETVLVKPTPPQALPPKLSPAVSNKPASTLEIISQLAFYGFLGWTALCIALAGFGFLNTVHSETRHPVLTSNDPMEQTAGTAGFFIGLFLEFVIWLMGAVPTALIYFVTRRK
jgi:DNA-directed RNA polymerase subunit RPC12/RpoP